MAEHNGRVRLTPGLAIQVVVWLVGVLLAYGVIRADVAVLQSLQDSTDRRLERIEQKLDELLRRP